MSSSTSCSAAHTWIHSLWGFSGVSSRCSSTYRTSFMNELTLSSFWCLNFLRKCDACTVWQKAMYVYNDGKTTDFPHGGSPRSFQDILSPMSFASRPCGSLHRHAIKLQKEAIRWSPGRSCRWRSVLCPSSGASEESGASSSPPAA